MLEGKSSYSVIKEYSDSELAKIEKNDCIVRALAVAYDIKYEEAHKIAKEKFGREFKKGTKCILGFEANKGMIINEKPFSIVESDKISYTGSSRYEYEKNKQKDHKIRIVVRQFVEDFPKGTYIVLVREHGFVVKDGIIIGNPEDSRKARAKVLNAVKIGE